MLKCLHLVLLNLTKDLLQCLLNLVLNFWLNFLLMLLLNIINLFKITALSMLSNTLNLLLYDLVIIMGSSCYHGRTRINLLLFGWLGMDFSRILHHLIIMNNFLI